MNEKLLSLLRTLAEQPRGLKWFANNGYGTREAVLFNLRHLAQLGYVDEPYQFSTCSFHISDKGRQYLADLKPAESRSFVSRDPYVPGKWTPARAGADSHKQYASHGIVRAA